MKRALLVGLLLMAQTSFAQVGMYMESGGTHNPVVAVGDTFTVDIVLEATGATYTDGGYFIAMNENYFQVVDVRRGAGVPSLWSFVGTFWNSDPTVGTAVEITWIGAGGLGSCLNADGGGGFYAEVDVVALQGTDGRSGYSAFWVPVECNLEPYATYIWLCSQSPHRYCVLDGFENNSPFYVKAKGPTLDKPGTVETTFSKVKEVYQN